MLYKIVMFGKGEVRWRGKKDAPNHLQAIKTGAEGSNRHALVIGKTAKRFAPNGKEITDTPVASKVLWKGKHPSIILMFGKYPEVYKFRDEKTRDEKFTEIEKCITSMCAGSAKAKAELTGIIASFGEISGTKSISTSRKTLSGYAITAICRDLRTLESTGKTSGTDSAVDTVTNTWSDGSMAFPSRLRRTFFATVQTLPTGSRACDYPGVNSSMVGLQGKTMMFRKVKHHTTGNIYKDTKFGWYWKQQWLDPYHIHATIKEHIRGSELFPLYGDTERRIAGKTLSLEYCFCGCGGYKYGTTYISPKWLEAKRENE